VFPGSDNDENVAPWVSPISKLRPVESPV